MRICFGRQGLFSATAGRQQLPLLGVSPFHSPVLEPDFDLFKEILLLKVES